MQRRWVPCNRSSRYAEFTLEYSPQSRQSVAGMTRSRHTPYKAQLTEYLAGTPTRPFSARSLADDVFDNGTRDRNATLRGIQEALRDSYADGRLVALHDADGAPLHDGTDNGGKATKHTLLYIPAEAVAPVGAT